MKDFNYEVLKEQEQVLKMLADKVGLKVDDDTYSCVCRIYSYFLGNQVNYEYDNDSKKNINDLSKMIGEYIKEGKLNNWVKENIVNYSIEELINIEFFWESYIDKLYVLGRPIPSGLSDEEIEKLNALYYMGDTSSLAPHILTNSLCDYHESNDEYDDGSTVFSYTETRRYM